MPIASFTCEFGNEIRIYTELVCCYYNVYDELDYIGFAVESI